MERAVQECGVSAVLQPTAAVNLAERVVAMLWSHDRMRDGLVWRAMLVRECVFGVNVCIIRVFWGVRVVCFHCKAVCALVGVWVWVPCRVQMTWGREGHFT